jgi:hypothetical protein
VSPGYPTKRRGVVKMATNRQRLSRAVRLLDKILLEQERRIELSGQGSSRELLAGLYKLKKLLEAELREPTPDWTGLVVPLLREAVMWLGEIINNYRYIFHRFQAWKRYEGIDLGTRFGNQILPLESRGQAKESRRKCSDVPYLSLAHRERAA